MNRIEEEESHSPPWKGGMTNTNFVEGYDLYVQSLTRGLWTNEICKFTLYKTWGTI
jgi:hypothetical protein